MSTVNYEFCDYLGELWNLYEIRGGLSSANAARRILDLRDEILVEFDRGVSAHEFFLDDINSKDDV